MFYLRLSISFSFPFPYLLSSWWWLILLLLSTSSLLLSFVGWVLPYLKFCLLPKLFCSPSHHPFCFLFHCYFLFPPCSSVFNLLMFNCDANFIVWRFLSPLLYHWSVQYVQIPCYWCCWLLLCLSLPYFILYSNFVLILVDCVWVDLSQP